MSYEPPTPPAELPTELVNTLNEYPSEQLQHVARYAEELAEHKAREARLEEDSDESEIEERPDDLPDDVPAKATITIKEINDNRYYYWQWREGDKVTSKYKGPVNPDEWGVNISDYRFPTPRVLFDLGTLGKVVTTHLSSRVKTVGTRKNLRLN
jgi:hypothetical protein